MGFAEIACLAEVQVRTPIGPRREVCALFDTKVELCITLLKNYCV